jgi:hypothetical protein
MNRSLPLTGYSIGTGTDLRDFVSAAGARNSPLRDGLASRRVPGELSYRMEVFYRMRKELKLILLRRPP